MRRFMALFLLIVISFQQLYNLWNIAWFYTHREYIAENLCINRNEPMTMCGGSCYLVEKLTDFRGSDADLSTGKSFESPKIFEVEIRFCFSPVEFSPQEPADFCIVCSAVEGFKGRVLHPPITC